MPVKLHLNVFYYNDHPHETHVRLCDESGGSGALVPPGRGKGTDALVVAGQAVDTGLNENETAVKMSVRASMPACAANVQLGVLVLAVDRQMLADGDSLLDEHVEVLGDLRSEA